MFLLKPEIIVAYYFKSELGGYFEVTSKWYAAPGELSTHPGFRIMEVHLFLFEFVFPWWNKATEHWTEVFKQTFESLNGCDLGDEVKGLKKKQILKGIKAGCDEIVKMMEDLLSPPLIYLALTYMPKVPSILRVLLALVTQEGIQLPDDGWDRYEYDSLDDWLEEE